MTSMVVVCSITADGGRARCTAAALAALLNLLFAVMTAYTFVVFKTYPYYTQGWCVRSGQYLQLRGDLLLWPIDWGGHAQRCVHGRCQVLTCRIRM